MVEVRERGEVGHVAEHLHGDRDGGLAVLDGRWFDAVIDTSGYPPRARTCSDSFARASGDAAWAAIRRIAATALASCSRIAGFHSA